MIRLLRHIVLTGLVLSASAHGAITYSGVQNLSISPTFGGLYIDFDNASDAGSFVLNPVGVSSSSTTPVPWDFNFFFGGAGIAVSDTSAPHTSGTGSLDPVLNLTAGALLTLTDTYPVGFSGSLAHMGAAAGQFTSSAGGGPGGTEGYIGFRIEPASFAGSPPPTAMVGWLRVTLEDDGSSGVLHDWAWETVDSSIEIGAVPEPGVPFLALVATVTLAWRRRRRG